MVIPQELGVCRESNENRLLFKSGFINYWILGSVKLVLKMPFLDAILVEY